ncbi:Hypothetical predicted protein [Paramuricea clavata]|uniref:Uncharacterized protein n=1 Tax=Paramuricea clavata TaxID=317549 RepID=A0A7D9HS33_PARCT|nr:Hypothetical predicted protein [Paramuricea clavata]
MNYAVFTTKFSSDSSSDPDQDDEQRDSKDECWSDIPEDVLNRDILSPPAAGGDIVSSSGWGRWICPQIWGIYTAEQWKNWTLVYSLYALKDILGDEHLNCWQAFVLKVSNYMATWQKLQICICTVTWCFSFERYNGTVRSITTNNRSVELQLMRKITIARLLGGIQLAQEFNPYFGDILSSLENSVDVSCCEGQTTTFSNLLEYLQMDKKMPLHTINWSNLSTLSLPTDYKESVLEDEDTLALLQGLQGHVWHRF